MIKTLDPLLLPPEAWRPSESLDGRKFSRVNERELDRISVWLELPAQGGDEKAVQRIKVKLWDFSPTGFAVLLDPAKAGPARLQKGGKAGIAIDFGAGLFRADCSIQNASQLKGQLRIGLARLDLESGARERAAGGSEGECLRIAESVDIRVIVANPIFYGEWADMRLCAVRPGLGLELQSRDDSIPLFVGQTIHARLALPTSGDNLYRGEIISLEMSQAATIKIGIRPISLSPGLANDLAESLVFESDISPETLKRFGFPTRFFRNRIAFRFVENMEDYEKVLILRRNAYVEVGKRGPATAPEEMSIAWDKTSRILCAFHEGMLVASAALTFPNSESVTLRSETAFPGNKFPGNPPPKTALLEINSLCTHKDYRRGDLLHAVFEQIARIFILSDRKYIMNLSDSTLLPMYLGIGFKAQGEIGQFLGRPHHLIKVPREAATKARGLGLLRWNILYGDLMADILSKKMLEFTPWERIMLRARLALKPLADKLHRSSGERLLQRMISNNGVTGS